MTPEEHIRRFESCVVDADFPGMADAIGELHAIWLQLDAATRARVLTLDSIFLTMLNARVRAAPAVADPKIVRLADRRRPGRRRAPPR
jgi:hypothetical protein